MFEKAKKFFTKDAHVMHVEEVVRDGEKCGTVTSVENKRVIDWKKAGLAVGGVLLAAGGAAFAIVKSHAEDANNEEVSSEVENEEINEEDEIFEEEASETEETENPSEE